MHKIIRILLVVISGFGTITACGGGGEDGLYVGGGGGFRQEVNCKKAFDNDRAFCSSFNPGVCCEHYNCGFFTCSTDCACELGLCCQKGYNLCPSLNICVTDMDHCPGEEEPLDSGVFISEVEASFCAESDNERNIVMHGIAYGPVGTEVKVFIPDYPEINSSVFCTEWEFLDFDYTGTGCTRKEDDPTATSWYFSFPQNFHIGKPAPEFDIIFYTDSESVSFTQMSCP